MKPFWKYFLSAHIDEIQLDELARYELEEYFNSVVSIESFKQAYTKLPIEVLTRILYVYLKEIQSKQFNSLIDKINIKIFDDKKQAKLIFVPGMYYKEYPELGADGNLLGEIAGRLNISYQQLETESLGSISDNANLITDAVTKDPHQSIWLVSLSRGSLEVRKFLESLGEKIPKNLTGWVNISGISHGSKLADMRLDSFSKKVIIRLLAKLLGANYQALPELRTDYPQWSSKFPEPRNFQQIHVAPMPIAPHVNRLLQKRYQQLSEYGPNDGMILLENYLRLPGHIYPFWGADHLLRTHQVSELFYKLCYFIHYQLYKGINNEKDLSRLIYDTSTC